MTFVFCQVGNTLFASIMVKSLRSHMPGATVIQCSDRDTKAVEGVDRVHRIGADSEHKMLFRMECFAGLNLNEPAMFLDTDMIFAAALDPAEVLEGHDVAACRRSYNGGLWIRPKGYGVSIDLPEYRNKRYGDVYPYLGCVTVTKDVSFWSDCFERYKKLPEKFWGWFGDQEVIRDAVASGKYKVKDLPERRYACLIDVDQDPEPLIVHFKGKNRKPMMLDAAGKLGLWKEENV